MPFNRNKQPCKYFQQGNCNKGSQCSFAHVYTNNTGGFSASTQPGKSIEEKYKDLTDDKNWDRYTRDIQNDMNDYSSFQLNPKATSYGLAFPCPVNLIAGRDLSPEENRFQYWQASKNGQSQQYETQMNARNKDMEKCVTYVKQEARKAARYIQLSTKNYRNTGSLPTKPFIDHSLDLTGNSYGMSNFLTQSSPFGNPQGSGPFVQSSNAFGQSNNAFGQSNNAFGQSNNAFGQSSNAFGQSSNAFGQSSNAFGQSSNAFGQSSNAFGQPAFGSLPSSSGSSSTPQDQTGNSGSLFGKPVFNSTSFGASPFQNTSTLVAGSSSSPFSTTSSTKPFSSTVADATNTTEKGSVHNTFGNQGAFQMGGFSAFSKPNVGQNVSGPNSTKANENVSSLNSSFGQPSFGASSFGQSSFGSPSFGNSSFGQSAFGSSSVSQTPFGQSVSNPSTTTPGGGSAFGQPNNNTLVQNTSLAANTNPVQTSQSTEAMRSNSPFGHSTFNGSTNSTPFSSFGAQTSTNIQNFGVLNAAQNTLNNTTFKQGMEDFRQSVTKTDLSTSTLKYFDAPVFHLGQVPDVPPPSNMVN